ncbi:MAG: hypothetical protein WCE30_21875, partial [Mycobacterium sp.]
MSVERDHRLANSYPQTPADEQLREWGWDPNRLNPAQLEIMARRYAHPDKSLMPHVDASGNPLSPDALGIDDLANAWLHASPDVNGATKFLPLIGEDDVHNRIVAKDDLLQKVNAESVDIRPNELGYRVATLNGTAPQVSDMIGPADKLKGALDKALALHGKVRELYSGEYASNCLTKLGQARLPKLDEHIKALTTDGAAARKALTDTGTGARSAFQGFHDVVDRCREDVAKLAVASSFGGVSPQNVAIVTQAFADMGPDGLHDADPKTAVAAGAKQAAAAGDAMGKLFATPVGDASPVEVGPLQHKLGDDHNGGPHPGGGGFTGDGGGVPHGGGPREHVGPLGSPQSPMMPPNPGAGMPGVPQMPQVPQMPTVPQVPSFGGPQQPHTGLASDHHGGEPLHDSLDGAKDSDRRTSPESRAADSALPSPPVVHPGDPVRRGQLGADMKPLDKNGTGRMDADAVAPTQHNMDPHHHGKPDEVPTAVMVDGVPHAVKVDDPRLLEMMNTLGAATPDHPVEVLDAAAQADMPLSGYGQFLDDPMSAKTGDVVTGSKGTGFYMGDGHVLMPDGAVKPLIDVFEFRPPNSGFFHLDMPPLPVGDDTGPSGPAPARPGVEPPSAQPQAPQDQPSTQSAAAAPPP